MCLTYLIQPPRLCKPTEAQGFVPEGKVVYKFTMEKQSHDLFNTWPKAYGSSLCKQNTRVLCSSKANTHPGQGEIHFQLGDASAYAAALAKAKGDGGIWMMCLILVKPSFWLERVGIVEVLLITRGCIMAKSNQGLREEGGIVRTAIPYTHHLFCKTKPH